MDIVRHRETGLEYVKFDDQGNVKIADSALRKKLTVDGVIIPKYLEESFQRSVVKVGDPYFKEAFRYYFNTNMDTTKFVWETVNSPQK